MLLPSLSNGAAEAKGCAALASVTKISSSSEIRGSVQMSASSRVVQVQDVNFRIGAHRVELGTPAGGGRWDRCDLPPPSPPQRPWWGWGGKNQPETGKLGVLSVYRLFIVKTAQ